MVQDEKDISVVPAEAFFCFLLLRLFLCFVCSQHTNADRLQVWTSKKKLSLRLTHTVSVNIQKLVVVRSLTDSGQGNVAGKLVLHDGLFLRRQTNH